MSRGPKEQFDEIANARLAHQLAPTVRALRRQLFGDETAPFSSRSAARQWFRDVAPEAAKTTILNWVEPLTILCGAPYVAAGVLLIDHLLMGHRDVALPPCVQVEGVEIAPGCVLPTTVVYLGSHHLTSRRWRELFRDVEEGRRKWAKQYGREPFPRKEETWKETLVFKAVREVGDRGEQAVTDYWGRVRQRCNGLAGETVFKTWEAPYRLYSRAVKKGRLPPL